MVVGHERDARGEVGDGHEIILRAGGILILALGPLIHRAEAITHDRGPGERAGAMAAEILAISRILALVDEADGVPDFVRSDAGNNIGAISSLRVNETWVVHRTAERIQVSDATCFASHGTNDDPDTVT